MTPLTLEIFRSRLRSRLGGCDLYVAPRSRRRHLVPQVRVGGRQLYVQQAAWVLAGRTLDPELDIRRTCGHPHCCALAHLEQVRTPSVGRAFNRKISPERVAIVRALPARPAPGTLPGLAKAWGVSVRSLYRLRTPSFRRDYLPEIGGSK